jgi:hypothetical protein
VIVLVCGGRDYKDRNLVWRVLDSFLFDVLVHGVCKSGADFFADMWARNRGHKKVKTYPADWDAHGNAAGPIRNAFMLEDAKPNFVIAFPGGRGTANMVALATGKVPVLKVDW